MQNLDVIKGKITKNEELKRQLAYWNFHSKKVVFTNGCFDILHQGHIDYLAKAADEGDVLIVGINTDNSVKRIKGNNRPIQDEQSRALMVAALHFVDLVVLFDEDTPYNLIKTVQPDVLIKGSDYVPENIVGYDILKAKNGEVKTIDYLEGYSTTSIIDKIKNSKMPKNG